MGCDKNCASTDLPCSENEITVTLKVNVPIPGTNITLRGLTDTDKSYGTSVAVTGTSGISTSNMPLFADGVLVMTVTSEIDAMSDIELDFTVINPPSAVGPKDIRVDLSGFGGRLSDREVFSLRQRWGKCFRSGKARSSARNETGDAVAWGCQHHHC